MSRKTNRNRRRRNAQINRLVGHIGRVGGTWYFDQLVEYLDGRPDGGYNPNPREIWKNDYGHASRRWVLDGWCFPHRWQAEVLRRTQAFHTELTIREFNAEFNSYAAYWKIMTSTVATFPGVIRAAMEAFL